MLELIIERRLLNWTLKWTYLINEIINDNGIVDDHCYVCVIRLCKGFSKSKMLLTIIRVHVFSIIFYRPGLVALCLTYVYW